MDLIIGSHVSFTKDKQLLGCVEETLSYGANTFMFYTGAPQNTNRASIDVNKTILGMNLMKENNIDYNNVVVHAPYIINLANANDDEKYNFAINFLKQEIERCETLGINKLILHPGSHVGCGIDMGIENIINGLNIVLNKPSIVKICLETMSGKGTECAYTLEQIAEIIDGVNNKNRIGVCMDTCHLHDSGYDMSNFDKVLDKFDELIGLKYLECIHINDSKNNIGAKKDRHENFGYGYIGFENLINIIYNERIKNIPKILETPYVSLDDNSKERIYPPYKFEIDMIKNKEFNNNLINDIREYYKTSK
ncbi:MAG: deoxyribonuclease IV [Bacilli bacterium]|nr:deoxyribonuclease IV [Bacilli bacterium]